MIAFILFVNIYQIPNDDLDIYILDVGQGDAILLKTNDGKYALIDTGPDNSVIYQLDKVLPFWQKKLDFILITHSDQDHIGGLPFILEIYDVKELLINTFENENNEAFSYVEKKAQGKGLAIRSIDSNDDRFIGCCVKIDFLWPRKDMNIDLSINDSSISFVLNYKGFQMFFGGDLSSSYEELIFDNKKLDLDVLKVGHHGSKTSTSEQFIQITKPEYALISVGEDNRFSHPDQKVLERLDKYNIKTYRTDLHGVVNLCVQEDGVFHFR